MKAREFRTAFLWRWHLARRRSEAAHRAAVERRLARVMGRIERKAR